MNNPVSEEMVEAASAEVERLSRELDVTNADHIALWIEANTIPDEPMSQCASWLACRIVEAHEAAHQAEIAAAERRGMERAAGIARGPVPLDVSPESPNYGLGAPRNDFERGIDRGKEQAAQAIRTAMEKVK